MTRSAQPVPQVTSWVLLDETNGTPCQNKEVMTPEALALIAEAITIQLTRDYGPLCGGAARARAGSSASDIQPGETVFSFLPSLPDAPGAVAYHDVDGNGVPFAMEAISACSSLLGSGSSASIAASHECLETAGDPGCNQYADDGQGTMHARERCDAVEVNSYPVTTSSGSVVCVSDFVLDAWFIPKAPGPYTFTAAAGLSGVQPSGPMQTAAASGGDYQIVCPSTTAKAKQVTAEHAGVHVRGKPMRPYRQKHWGSRAYRRGVR